MTEHADDLDAIEARMTSCCDQGCLMRRVDPKQMQRYMARTTPDTYVFVLTDDEPSIPGHEGFRLWHRLMRIKHVPDGSTRIDLDLDPGTGLVTAVLVPYATGNAL